MSKIRRNYVIRFIGRIIVLIISVLLFFFHPISFEILIGWNFFKSFSPFHILWIIWIIDMIAQIIPIKNKLSIGSLKLFAKHFKPANIPVNTEKIKKYLINTTKSAFKVFILWTLLTIGIGILYFSNIIDKKIILLISILYYVGDLICVLIWCPFRLIMKNKCCTTCRIFNWDHLMMFSPLIFIGGFFSISLVTLSILAWLTWEICILIYPERFSEISNISLQCSECTDKLCTQYCKKLKK